MQNSSYRLEFWMFLFLFQVCKITDGELQGVVESINYPLAYSGAHTCIWNIIGSPKTDIVLNFTSFSNIRHSGGVHIHMMKPRIRLYECDAGCNKQIYVSTSGPIRIEGKSARLEFNTFNSYRNVIFKMEWWLKGCEYSIKGTKGAIHSPNFPRNYPNNANCKWKIITEPGSLVHITIHYWNLERSQKCQFDALKIYAGSNEKSQQLTTLCGEMGQQLFGLTMSSNFNTMFLTFTSDGSVAHRGFNASFIQISKQSNSCHGKYQGNYGFLYTPGYPNAYMSYQQCTLNFRVSPAYRAALKIVDWGSISHLYFCDHAVKVHGSTANLLLNWLERRLVGNKTMCAGLNHLYPKVVSSDNEITVILQRKTISWSRAFKAVYFQTCGTRLKYESGSLASPDFMTITMMSSNSSCTWTMEAPTTDHRVVLIYTKFKWTVNDELCTDHMVRIFDENNHTQSNNNANLNVVNGTNYYTGCCGPLPAPILSHGKTLTMDIKGLADLEFVAFYVTLSPECIYQLRSCQTKSLTDSHQDHCEKTVKVIDNQEIQVTFRNSSYRVQSGINQTTRCSINYVEIYQDGNLTETYCRRNAHMQELKVVSGTYWIIYFVDEDDKEVLNQREKQVITNQTVSGIEMDLNTSSGTVRVIVGFTIFVMNVFAVYAF